SGESECGNSEDLEKGMRTKRQLIEAYYRAWVKRDWDAATSFFATDFHLRSPIDDFRGIEKFRERCWPLGEGLREINLRDFYETDDAAFFSYEARTDKMAFRAAEIFKFQGEKIVSIDIYWGVLPPA